MSQCESEFAKSSKNSSYCFKITARAKGGSQVTPKKEEVGLQWCIEGWATQFREEVIFSKWVLYILSGLAVLMFYQNCGELKSNGVIGSSNQGLDLSEEALITRGKALYATHCAGCHGPIDSSSKKGRTFEQIEQAIASIGQMQDRLTGLDEEQVRAISAALIFEANGGGLEFNEQGRLQFACTPGSVSNTPLLKLVNREFRNSVNQILDRFSTNLKNDSELNQLYNTLPADSQLVDRNTRKEQSTLVSQLGTIAFFNAAYRAGEVVAANNAGLNAFNPCLAQSAISPTCHREFVSGLGELAFRRPLSPVEVDGLASGLWDGALSKQNQITQTFTAIIQMPEFQYKVFNRGQDVQGRQNLVELTPHELAARVAFLITGRGPDSQLRAAANNGQITNPTVLTGQVDRLLNDQVAQEMVVRIFRESYGYDVFQGLAYPNGFLNGVDLNGLERAMVNEMDDFFIETVLNQNGDFLDLMTSRHTRLDHNGLRNIYGVNIIGSGTLPTERAGFLNRAAMLTKRSGVRASPIKRGLNVLEHLLCIDVGAPPPSAPTSLPDVPGVVTTRENTELTSQAEGSSCVFCHDRFNPLGYAFENFDSLGRLRSQEGVFDGNGDLLASLPIDTADVSRELSSTPTTFSDSVDLSNQLGNSDRALLCFAKHLKRFESRVVPNNADNCQMNSALTALHGGSQGQGSIKEAIRGLILSDEFRYWSY